MGVELYEPLGRTSTTIAACWAAVLFFAGCQPKADGQAEPVPGSPSSAAPRRTAPSVASAGHPAASAAPPAASSTAAQAKRAESKQAYRIAAVGDSITDEKSFGGGYLRYVEERCPQTRIDNFAKGGHMVNQIRRRFENEVHNQPMGTYTHLVVFGGVNDLYSDLSAGRTPDKVERDLAVVYEKAREKGIQVVAITVSPWGGFKRYYNDRRQRYTEQLNAWIRAQLQEKTVDYVVDSYPLLSCGQPHELCPEYEQSSHDGLHLGKQGHQVLGRALYEQVFKDCL